MVIEIRPGDATVGVPYIDPNTWTLQYQFNTWDNFFDQATGGQDFFQTLRHIHNLNAMLPWWRVAQIVSTQTLVPLLPGHNILNVDNIGSVYIDLPVVDDSISRPWAPSDYGRIGYVRWLPSTGGNETWEFLESAHCAALAPLEGKYNGADIFLKGTTAGVASAYIHAGVPPLIYSYEEADYTYWFEQWVWNGPLPSLPDDPNPNTINILLTSGRIKP